MMCLWDPPCTYQWRCCDSLVECINQQHLGIGLLPCLLCLSWWSNEAPCEVQVLLNSLDNLISLHTNPKLTLRSPELVNTWIQDKVQEILLLRPPCHHLCFLRMKLYWNCNSMPDQLVEKEEYLTTRVETCCVWCSISQSLGNIPSKYIGWWRPCHLISSKIEMPSTFQMYQIIMEHYLKLHAASKTITKCCKWMTTIVANKYSLFKVPRTC